MKVSQDTERKFAIIDALAQSRKPTLQDLHQATGIPVPSLKRQIAALRAEFEMKILFTREATGHRGAGGYYTLVDWGIINRANFLKRCKNPA